MTEKFFMVLKDCLAYPCCLLLVQCTREGVPVNADLDNPTYTILVEQDSSFYGIAQSMGWVDPLYEYECGYPSAGTIAKAIAYIDRNLEKAFPDVGYFGME